MRLTRDKQYSHRLYVSVSENGARTWPDAVPTEIPDSPSRSYALTLPDGRVVLLGNFVSEPFGQAKDGHYVRDPLVLALSDDGVTFHKAYAIRQGVKPIVHPGKGKGQGFQYPHALVADDSLWVIYSIGKEDIAVTRVQLASL